MGMDYGTDTEWKGLSEMPQASYSMGFSVDKVPIPNPSEFSVTESNLDTMGERDATGLLHRNMVATKLNMKISWAAIPLSTIMDIGKLTKPESFEFSFKNPFSNEVETITAYAGDRSTDIMWAPANGIWIGDLSFSVIEY